MKNITGGDTKSCFLTPVLTGSSNEGQHRICVFSASGSPSIALCDCFEVYSGEAKMSSTGLNRMACRETFQAWNICEIVLNLNRESSIIEKASEAFQGRTGCLFYQAVSGAGIISHAIQK